MASRFLDFDGPPLDLVQHATHQARDEQDVRNDIGLRMDRLYHGVLNMAQRDPRRANVFLPKPFQVVETIVPRHIKANHGTRPFIPIEARRKEEFGHIASLQASLLDDYLEKSQFLAKRILQTKIAVVQGTAFMDSIPMFEFVDDPMAIYDGQGQLMQVVQRKVQRLRMKLQVWAPWEVLVDPRATGLEEKGQCRYVVKIMLTSRRELKRMYEQNAGNFPGINEAALYTRESGASTELTQHYGLQMLESLGLPRALADDDLEVLLRYESDERYVDVLGGDIVIRDMPNPYNHGQINLSRLIYTQRPHTQDQFWGLGALKPAEVLFAIRNDLMNNMLDNAHTQNQARLFIDDKQDSKNFSNSPGAICQIARRENEPLSAHFYESPSRPLNSDFYILPELMDNETDRTVGVFDMTRGETPEKTTTATQDVLRRDAGDIRLESGVIQDTIFLDDFYFKYNSNVQQVIGPQDVVEILGPEKAQEMYVPMGQNPVTGEPEMTLLTNPAELPGSFNLAHKGPDRVGEEVIKQQIAQNSIETIMSFPTTRPDKAQQSYMRRIGYSEEEIREQVMSMQELQEQQAQAAQSEQQAIETETQAEAQKLAQEQDFEARLSALEHQQDIELEVVKGAIKEQADDGGDNPKPESKKKEKVAA